MPKITQLELVGRRAGTQAQVCQLPNQGPRPLLMVSVNRERLPYTAPSRSCSSQGLNQLPKLFPALPVSVAGCQPQGTRTARLRNPNSKGPWQLPTAAPLPWYSPRTELWVARMYTSAPPPTCACAHTHTNHRAFHPQHQPALPGTQSLAEPGRGREGLAERVLGNSGLVNTPLGDLIRPPPGQRQAGEKVDNGHHGHGDATHPGAPSSFWNKGSRARPDCGERLCYHLPQTSQHQRASPQAMHAC